MGGKGGGGVGRWDDAGGVVGDGLGMGVLISCIDVVI